MTQESVDDVIDRLRATVADRKAAGEYPPGLEESLDRHFRQIAVHQTPRYDYDELRRRIGALAGTGSFDVDEIAFDTRIPGGSQLHRAVAKLVSRQTAGILAQVQRYADAVHEVLWEVLGALETPAAHSHADLDARLATAVEALAAAQRAEHVPAALAGLDARVQALETEERSVPTGWHPHPRFDETRRAAPEVRARHASLAERFRGCEGQVVDLACGDGGFLRLLDERGVDAVGVERRPDLVRAAREDGLDVEQGDPVPWLEGVADGRLGGICLVRAVERLHPQEVVELVALSRRKLRQGGQIVVETVNPQSLSAHAEALHLDAGVRSPVHPAYLQFLFREAGFDEVTIEWGPPPPDGTTLAAVPGDDEVTAIHNANIARLNQLLFAPQDYALVARR